MNETEARDLFDRARAGNQNAMKDLVRSATVQLPVTPITAATTIVSSSTGESTPCTWRSVRASLP